MLFCVSVWGHAELQTSCMYLYFQVQRSWELWKKRVSVGFVGFFLYLCIYMCIFIIFLSYTLYFCICRMEQSLFLLELCILSSWLLAVKENSISGSGVNQSLTEMHRYCIPLNAYLQNDLYAWISKMLFCFQRILHCIIHEPCSWD